MLLWLSAQLTRAHALNFDWAVGVLHTYSCLTLCAHKLQLLLADIPLISS